ncbi:transglycosylase domain-containing protein [Chitinophaga pollutisoli]|uniref:Transglycosylase domain-containing protein n=1 Tax=Chitinophaga pollutisoli TaxID=3133966 RepID=A0ABZ2YVL4_9BACT
MKLKAGAENSAGFSFLMWTRFKAWAYRRRWRLAIAALLLVGYYFLLPRQLFTAPTSFVIEDERGDLMGAAIAKDGQWRFPADKDVPDKFAKCIVAYEDKRFYYHWGIDPGALLRAVKQNLGGGRVVSGASTITMQVIRLHRNKPRTIWQKLVEMTMATRLEFRYSKNPSLDYMQAMHLSAEMWWDWKPLRGVITGGDRTSYPGQKRLPWRFCRIVPP